MSIGEFFNSYLLSGIAGCILSIIVIMIVANKKGIPKLRGFWLIVVATIGLLIGGHVLFFIVSLPDFIRDAMPSVHSFDQFISAVGNYSSGMVYYGSLFGALLATLIYVRSNHLNVRESFNLGVLIYPLAHAAGRVGCFLTGCCYGIEYHGPLAIHYPASKIIAGASDDLADFPRFPVQLLEALCELIIFFILLYFYMKKGDAFSVTCAYLILYPTVRFFDEFLRGDRIRGLWGPFSTSQWISLAILAVVISVLLIKNFRKRRKVV